MLNRYLFLLEESTHSISLAQKYTQTLVLKFTPLIYYDSIIICCAIIYLLHFCNLLTRNHDNRQTTATHKKPSKDEARHYKERQRAEGRD